MNIFEVSYTKRIRTADYEHEEVTLKAHIKEDDDETEAIARVKFACSQALSMVVRAAEPEVPAESAPAKKTTKKVAKKTTKKVTKKSPPKKEEEAVEAGPIADQPELLKEVVGYLREVIKAKGKEVALEILADFGVGKSNELCASQAAAVIEKAKKAVK